MGQRILSGILDRATTGARDVSVSCLGFFKVTAFPFGPKPNPAYPN
jgi:hypothetical protein